MDQTHSRVKREELLSRQTRLLPAQQALLEKRLRGKFKGVSQNNLAARIQPVSRDGAMPLTFRERRIIEIILAKSPGDLKLRQSLFRCFRLTGAFNPSAMEQAVNALAARHEVLRTKFTLVDGKPQRVISPTLSVSLPVTEVEHVAESQPLEVALKLVAEEAGRPFELIDNLLWRAVLLRLDTDDYMLLLVIDHFISDDWSMSLLVRDTWMLYQSFATGGVAALAELPIQYADYAHWQRQTLQGATLDKLVSYWGRQLEGMGPLPEVRLPIELPSPRLSGNQPAAAISIELPTDLSDSLKALGREHDVTLQVTMLSALFALLHLYTGRTDLGICTISAKRLRPEIKEVVGCFTDNEVLRANVSGSEGFSELLQRVHRTVIECYEHNDLPYMMFPGPQSSAKVNEHLLHPSVSFNMLTREGWPRGTQQREDASSLPSLNVTSVNISLSTHPSLRKPGITVVVTESNGGLHLFLIYTIERYEISAMREFLINYRSVLERIVANPQVQLAELSISFEQQAQHEELEEESQLEGGRGYLF